MDERITERMAQMEQLLRRGITPRQILTREALLNGVAGAMPFLH